MHKATGFAIANGFSNRSGSDGGGKGHGAAGQRFAQTQNVGGNPGVFTSEQLAGAAKAGGNLIGDQQYPFPVAHFTHPLQPLRMVHPHAARPLDDRFEDHRGDFVTMRGHQAGKRYHIHLVPLAVEAALRRGEARTKKRRAGLRPRRTAMVRMGRCLRRSRRCLRRIGGCLSFIDRACPRMQSQAARTHPQGFFTDPQAARQGPQGFFMGPQASRQAPQVFSIARCLPAQASASRAARSASLFDRSMPAAARSASLSDSEVAPLT